MSLRCTAATCTCARTIYSAVGVLESRRTRTRTNYFLFLVDQVGDGWAAGGSVTVNSWRHFSNEFSYFRQQVKYELDDAESGFNEQNTESRTLTDDLDSGADRAGNAAV